MANLIGHEVGHLINNDGQRLRGYAQDGETAADLVHRAGYDPEGHGRTLNKLTGRIGNTPKLSLASRDRIE